MSVIELEKPVIERERSGRLGAAAARRQARRLSGLTKLASMDIDTPMVARLSRDLHRLFDPVSEDALPIYFGPLLGRLYLEGL